jgi:ferric-dicitrate binding protein FerR (iron transport regulator)
MAELADLLSDKLEAGAREQLVIALLDEMASRHLLQESTEVLDEIGPSRRRVMSKMALGVGVAAAAGIALPLIKSIVVPTPAQAASNGDNVLLD